MATIIECQYRKLYTNYCKPKSGLSQHLCCFFSSLHGFSSKWSPTSIFLIPDKLYSFIDRSNTTLSLSCTKRTMATVSSINTYYFSIYKQNVKLLLRISGNYPIILHRAKNLKVKTFPFHDLDMSDSRCHNIANSALEMKRLMQL